MLDLLDGAAQDQDGLYYMDPDVCVSRDWSFFLDWLSCGVALCEDVNSPVYEHHPRRIGWREYFGKYNVQLSFKGPAYVNGGLVGVKRKEISFLHQWRQLCGHMAEEIGSLAATTVAGGAAYKSTGFANCFDIADQDALNAAIEATNSIVSVIGQEAMASKPRRALVPHAIGSAKPWRRRYLSEGLRGKPPRLVDKIFWKHASGPIACFGRGTVFIRNLEVTLMSALGRYYRRS